MDDPFISCPYVASHRVPRSRIQAHIIKCKHQNPKYMICPYNATHRMPEGEIKAHVLNCPSKEAIFPEKLNEKMKAKTPVKLQRFPPENDPNNEIWDD